MDLTKRQALFLIIICLSVNKVQRLPSLISTNIGRHGWLVFLIMGFIDVIFLLLALWFNKKAGGCSTYEICEKAGGKLFAKIICLFFVVFYLIKSLLPYEAVHDLFANILFDHLSWGLYSLLLGVSILFIASRELRNIGRLSEIFFYIILVSFISLLILGATTTNYFRFLPVADINVGGLIGTCFEYNIWYGDFLIIYAFVGRMKQEDGSLGWPVIVSMIVCTIVLSFTYIVFYGLYEHLTPNQNSLISAISQFSLLGLDIGRVDWFLVLFFQVATLISSSLYLYLSSNYIRQVFGIKNNVLVMIILVGLIYIADIFIFKSVQEGAGILATASKYFSILMIVAMPIVLIITAFVASKKIKRKKGKIDYSIQKYCLLVKASKFNSVPSRVAKQLNQKLINKKPSKKRRRADV